jgi:CRISPR-associated protein Cst2
MNLFATVLTYPAPSANYRGESELNRSVMQKVTDGRFDFPIISPEAMRNALREILASPGYDLPCNRKRLEDEDQPAVQFAGGYPDPDTFADDYFFGYLVAAGDKERKSIRAEVKEKRGEKGLNRFAFKRDSVLRMNMAKALEPYRHNTVFTQSPQDKTPKEVKSHVNVDKAQLLHRETCVTAFQYPFALNGNDCKAKPDWTKKLLRAIGELTDVAGNHARSYYVMAPASIVVRLTNLLVPGYDTYGFQIVRKPAKKPGLPERQFHRFSEVIRGILRDPPDYPGSDFYIGGKIVKQMPQQRLDAQCGVATGLPNASVVKQMPQQRLDALKSRGVTLERDPRRLLEIVASRFLES